MNILVTGANGQLGREIRHASIGIDDHYVFSDIAGDDVVRLDITDAEAVNRFVDENNIDILINCAAYTDVERAESEPEIAEALNAAAPKILAAAMKRVDGLLIHISTDYVFGGTPHSVPIVESERPCPTGVYGSTKLHGEKAIAGVGGRYIIFRTAWLYSPYGKNFVKTMLSLTATRPAIQVVNDQFGSPTYAADLAKAIVDIVSARKFEGREGIYNYTDEGECSWYDFAVAIAQISGHRDCKINPCTSAQYPSKVVRPAYSVLDKSKFRTTFGIEIPVWTDSLKKCIEIIERQ